MRRLFLVFALLGICLASAAQKTSQSDSLVRLMSASSAKLVNEGGQNFREVIGPARFLHNDTYLICDTAYWYVDNELIKAVGNVKIIQDETVLSSDNLDYVIPENLAKFRGGVVQLQDKDKNTMRTRWLDYNTKDSVALFRNGGVLRDKDGQIIESRDGRYDSKVKTFYFNGDVNMYTDSVFIKTRDMQYNTRLSLATFGPGTNAWRDDDMLSSEGGWYDRAREIFFFTDRVHGMTRDQEGWADSVFFYRNTQDVEMFGNVQVLDTTRQVAAVGGYMQYIDSLSTIRLERDAAVMAQTKGAEDKVDTVYVGADTLIYRSVPRCDVPQSEIDASAQRLSELKMDPVAEYRRKAREEAERAAKQALEDNPELALGRPPRNPAEKEALLNSIKASAKPAAGQDEPTAGAPADTLNMPLADSLSVADSLRLSPADSLMLSPADSLAPVALDSTATGFITAINNVKVFRTDMQVACDSLLFNDLDSLARLYKNPVVWNEGTRQYSADSLYVLVKNRAMRQASLMSNAFIIVQEDSICFDQIRATEMMAYFDSVSTSLSRFDALGGASALFYLREDDVLATANKAESKMLSAWFKEGKIDKVYYFEAPKNDASPVAQMTRAEKEIKGFNWDPSRRPAGKKDVTPLEMRASQREQYSQRPRATFKETEIYFPGYMESIYKGIREKEAMKAERESASQEPFVEDPFPFAVEPKDSAEHAAVPVLESETPVKEQTDEVKENPVSEGTPDVSAAVEEPSAEAEKVSAKSKRAEAREARWAELDARDAAKAKAKEEKAMARKRAKTLKILQANAREAEKDQKKLERFKVRFEKKKAREDALKAKKEAARTKEKDPDAKKAAPDEAAFESGVTGE